METDQEIRLRCLEAAARNPTPHPQGYAAGVIEAAERFEKFVRGERKTLDDLL